MKKSLLTTFLLLAILISALPARAAEGEAAPDAVQTDVQKLLADYHAALVAGDRKKALALVTFKGPDQEKIARLAVDLDFALHDLLVLSEKKLGKESAALFAESLGIMTTAANRDALITSTDDDDLVVVQWYPNSTLEESKRVISYCPIRKTKDGWRFDLFADEDETASVDFRKSLRDELAELAEIQTALNDNTLNTAEAFQKRLEKFIKEVLNDPDAAAQQI